MSKLVIVSNRIPKIFDGQPNAGGLVNGVLDALQNGPCTWLGWNGEINNEIGKSHLYKKDNIQFITTSLTEEEYNQYYCQFSNQVIWPTFHARGDLCHYDDNAYQTYLRVNERIAKLVLSSSGHNDKIWIHDYHLLPLAKACRRLGITNPIGFFLHIPFPKLDTLKTIPCYQEILAAMLNFDLLGFQTEDDLNAFSLCIKETFAAATISDNEVIYKGNKIKLGVYPIGISVTKINNALDSIKNNKVQPLTINKDRKIIVNADRLDYIKGLVNSVLAYENLLNTKQASCDEVMLYHINALSREYIADYQHYRVELESRINIVNQQWQYDNKVAIHYTNKAQPRDKLLSLLNAADVGLITSFCDGMNLIAKEFIATQSAADPGVLVLSKYTGVAKEFADGAILIDPNNIDDISTALQTALAMPKKERKARHQSLYKKIQHKDASYWFNSFLADLPSNTLSQRAISY